MALNDLHTIGFFLQALAFVVGLLAARAAFTLAVVAVILFIFGAAFLQAGL